MAKNKESTPSIEKHEIEGHSLQIQKEGDIEKLYIDGVREKFFKNEYGYALHSNAYQKPHKSLIEAVKNNLQPSSSGSGKKKGGTK